MNVHSLILKNGFSWKQIEMKYELLLFPVFSLNSFYILENFLNKKNFIKKIIIILNLKFISHSLLFLKM